MLSLLMTTEYAPAEDRYELQRLLLRVAEGEREALAELYRRTRSAVYGLTLSYLKNAHDAQDLTQDVYVQVWDCAEQYRPTGSPTGWLLTVCRNLCLMRLRREERHAALSEEEWDAIPAQECGLDADERTLLQQALASLAPRSHGYEAPGDRGAAGAAASDRPVEISQSIEKNASLSGRRRRQMTNEKMEQRLAAAVEKTAPNDVNGVLSRCEERKGTVIPMTTKKTTKRKWTSLIAACLAVMLLGGGGLFYQRANAVASVVSLDVNPSIELKVNRSEKVLVCTPLNEDAKTILADMGNGADLKGAKLDVAVNAIVGSLVRNGYLNSISSAIMISVEDKDTARAEKLQRELTSAVDGVLQTSEAKAAVLTQTLTQDAAREQQARENNISTGKAALVNRVLALNATLKFDALAKLSVEELKDLAEAGAPAMPIGKAAAAYAAEQYAGTTALDSVTAEVDSELDEFPAHYEVELHTAWGEFEYLVDAYTGKVISGQKDLLAAVSASNETTKPSGQKPAPSGTVQDIGYAKAKSIALNHAGVSENEAYDMEIELDDEDGTLVYEVEFKSGGMEYSYEINAASGAILKHEAEIDD